MINKHRGGFMLFLAFAGALLFLLFRQNPSSKSTESAAENNRLTEERAAIRTRSGAMPAASLPPTVAVENPGQKPSAEPEFAAFTDWSHRYASASDAAAKAALETEGVTLARARLIAMADLVQSDPRRALELAMPFAVRKAMPPNVRALLEEQINARGDLRVAGVLPVDPSSRALPPVLRSATINGEEYRVYTFGRGNEFVTRDNVPLNGIAVPASAATRSPANELINPKKLFVPSESPARFLDPAEIYALNSGRTKEQEPLCSVSGQLVSSKAEETVVQLGGDLAAAARRPICRRTSGTCSC